MQALLYKAHFLRSTRYQGQMESTPQRVHGMTMEGVFFFLSWCLLLFATGPALGPSVPADIPAALTPTSVEWRGSAAHKFNHLFGSTRPLHGC